MKGWVKIMEVTVNQFLSYFGGLDNIVIEDQEVLNKNYWQGTVDEWFKNPDEVLKEKGVITSSVIGNTLVIRVFGKEG